MTDRDSDSNSNDHDGAHARAFLLASKLNRLAVGCVHEPGRRVCVWCLDEINRYPSPAPGMRRRALGGEVFSVTVWDAKALRNVTTYPGLTPEQLRRVTDGAR
jgi:hypothetical protein